jgi:gluconokinase
MALSTTGEVAPVRHSIASDSPRRPVVVMGVSASGKTSVAAELAALLDAPMADADDLHPPANIAKMAAGIPLEDTDRWPWLKVVGERLAASDRPVMACSALKRAYRDRLRSAAPDCVFVHLVGTQELLAARARNRGGHFMPPALLQSQFDALEMLQPDEMGIELGVDAPVPQIGRRAKEWVDGLQARSALRWSISPDPVSPPFSS